MAVMALMVKQRVTEYIGIHPHFIGLLTCSLSMMNREIRWIGVRVRVHVHGFVSSFFFLPLLLFLFQPPGEQRKGRESSTARARSTAARLSLPVPSGVLQLLPAHRRCESISFSGEFFGRDIRGVFPGGLVGYGGLPSSMESGFQRRNRAIPMHNQADGDPP